MLTEKHLLILEQLRQDSRMSLAEIGRVTGLPTSTVFDYYKDLLDGAIVRHTSLPDWHKLGYPLQKRFVIQAKDRERLFSFLTTHPRINNAYRLDRTRALCEACFEDVNAVEEFKQQLREEVHPRELKEFDILEELKHEGFMVKPSRS